MSDTKQFKIRCRAVILHDGKLLVVKQAANTKDSYSLPGGHLEYGEDIEDCMRREVFEELGVEATLGKLLYINSFIDGDAGTHSVEFFFEVKNGKNFTDTSKLIGTHSHELAGVLWSEKGDGINVLPQIIRTDLDSDQILTREALFNQSSRNYCI